MIVVELHDGKRARIIGKYDEDFPVRVEFANGERRTLNSCEYRIIANDEETMR